MFEENLGEDGGGCFSVARKKKRMKVEQALMLKIVAVFFFTIMQLSETVMWMSMVVTLFMVAAFVPRVQR